jgi:hypothetical protein
MNAPCRTTETAAPTFGHPLLADDQAVFTISAAAEMLAITPHPADV